MFALSSCSERLHPAGALAHAERCGIDVEHDAGLRRILTDLERRLPGGDVEQEIVSGLRSGTRAPGPHGEGAVLWPERVRACRERHRQTLGRRQRDGEPLAVERHLAAERADERHRDRGAEVPLLLAEHDRRRALGHRLEPMRGPSTVTCTSHAAVPRGRPGELMPARAGRASRST